MALIENAKGRSGGGYSRLFGIEPFGRLISRIQGAVISSGTELEKMIWERVNRIDDLDKFLADNLHTGADRLFIARKNQIKASKTINSKYEPDFVAFNPFKRECYVIEVKDGDAFDTKKAAGEHVTLRNFINDISQALPYTMRMYCCSFNCKTKQEVYNGLKRKFALTEVMTGKDLADLFLFDYDEIVKIRTSEQQSNLDYFLNDMLKIDNIRNAIVKRLKTFRGGGVT